MTYDVNRQRILQDLDELYEKNKDKIYPFKILKKGHIFSHCFMKTGISLLRELKTPKIFCTDIDDRICAEELSEQNALKGHFIIRKLLQD